MLRSGLQFCLPPTLRYRRARGPRNHCRRSWAYCLYNEGRQSAANDFTKVFACFAGIVGPYETTRRLSTVLRGEGTAEVSTLLFDLLFHSHLSVPFLLWLEKDHPVFLKSVYLVVGTSVRVSAASPARRWCEEGQRLHHSIFRQRRRSRGC